MSRFAYNLIVLAGLLAIAAARIGHSMGFLADDLWLEVIYLTMWVWLIVALVGFGLSLYHKQFAVAGVYMAAAALLVAGFDFKWKAGHPLEYSDRTIRLLSFDCDNKNPPPSFWKKVSNEPLDLLCLQGYVAVDSGRFLPDSMLFKKGLVYHHSVQAPNKGCNMAIFSKHPFVKIDSIWTPAIACSGIVGYKILVDGFPVKIINTQLESYQLNQVTASRSAQVKLEPLVVETQDLQKRQITTLIDVLHSEKTPVLVAGNFNASPVSLNIDPIGHLLQDAFEKAGSGFGYTARVGVLPVRSDYQFYDTTAIQCLGFKVEKIPYQLHNATLATYGLKGSL